jgi:hypothetical protein
VGPDGQWQSYKPKGWAKKTREGWSSLGNCCIEKSGDKTVLLSIYVHVHDTILEASEAKTMAGWAPHPHAHTRLGLIAKSIMR